MINEIYSDGVSEITVTGSIIRIDLMSLSPSERDHANNPKPVVRQRIIMPADAFANAADLMQKVVQGLIESGAIRPGETAPGAHDPVPLGAPRPARNTSPNFS
ncbi:hypothetical protein [Methylobacterium crusticola]|nr:hypothetical protein [Methylobacterium crusticola]